MNAHRGIIYLLIGVLLVLGNLVYTAFFSGTSFRDSYSPYPVEAGQEANQVVYLKAKPWNNGMVHIWADIVETRGSETEFTDMSGGTRCEQLDNKMYELIGPPPPHLLLLRRLRWGNRLCRN